jgi:hypothetical protein
MRRREQRKNCASDPHQISEVIDASIGACSNKRAIIQQTPPEKNATIAPARPTYLNF